MAKTYLAPQGQTQQNNTTVVTTAYDNITDDSPSNTANLVTAGTDGALVTKITAIPRATVTATCLGLWFTPDSGTTLRLVDTEVMAAHTVAATTAVPEVSFSNISETTPLRLQASEELYVGIGVNLTEGIVFYAEWVDL